MTYIVVKTMPGLPPMTGNGKHTTYKNGDEYGMVHDIVWTTLLCLDMFGLFWTWFSSFLVRPLSGVLVSDVLMWSDFRSLRFPLANDQDARLLVIVGPPHDRYITSELGPLLGAGRVTLDHVRWAYLVRASQRDPGKLFWGSLSLSYHYIWILGTIHISYVYVYINMYIYICMYIYFYIYIYICVYIYVYRCIYKIDYHYMYIYMYIIYICVCFQIIHINYIICM